MREHVLATRALIPPTQRAAWDRARTDHLLTALDERAIGVLACYLSIAPEPDTLALLDAALTRGWRVLAPKLRRRPDWAWYTGRESTAPGWQEIPQPTGTGLGCEALREADLVMVSALAVGSTGIRLGVGGGWYDRALRYRRPDAEAWALLHPGEWVARVPSMSHDARVDAVCLPDAVHRISSGRPKGSSGPVR